MYKIWFDCGLWFGLTVVWSNSDILADIYIEYCAFISTNLIQIHMLVYFCFIVCIYEHVSPYLNRNELVKINTLMILRIYYRLYSVPSNRIHFEVSLYNEKYVNNLSKIICSLYKSTTMTITLQNHALFNMHLPKIAFLYIFIILHRYRIVIPFLHGSSFCFHFM